MDILIEKDHAYFCSKTLPILGLASVTKKYGNRWIFENPSKVLRDEKDINGSFGIFCEASC